MKAPAVTLLIALAIGTAVLAQGPLTPPPDYHPAVGPANALTPGGLPQATMKTLHQVEPRTPLAAGQPGVTQEANGGFTVSATGSYYLTANLTVAAGTGVRIVADRVALDLNGFTISSTSPTPSGVGVYVEGVHHGLAVRNGFISGGTTLTGTEAPYVFASHGFGAGVLSEDHGPDGTAYIAVIEDLDVRGCAGRGIYVLGGKFRNCTVDGCRDDGLAGSTAVDCTAARCLGIGFSVDIATRCEAYGNGGHGISCWTASQCTAFQNVGTGIVAGGTASGCQSTGNHSHGISAESAAECSSSENLGDGIRAAITSNCQSKGNLLNGFTVNSASGCLADDNIGDGFSLGMPGTPALAGGSALNCIALNNDFGFRTGHATLNNCTASRNTGGGFEIYAGAVTQCTAAGNGASGHYGGFRLGRCSATACHADTNDGHGFVCAYVVTQVYFT